MKLRTNTDRSRLAAATMLLAAAFSVVCAPGTIARAAEARPWLCRDKPVFSSSKPVHYEAKSRGQRRWRLFFMQFVADGPHDGFATVGSNDIPAGTSNTEGKLASGQYFAVALYLGQGGHWVCPGSAQEAEGTHAPGVVSELCYSDDDSDSCLMRLTIRR